MARKDFKGFRAPKTTHKPAGETKQQFFDRVHETVQAGETIRDLWLVYYQARFATRVDPNRPLEPHMIALLQEVFYSGVASMMQLLTKSAEGGNTDADVEAGAMKVQRLVEELDTFTKNLR